MADFQTVAKASEIAAGEMKLVEYEGEEVVIANVDGSFFAFGNKCTHVGGPLVEGNLDDDTVTCPWHSTMFNVRSGESLGGPGENPVPTYEVRVEGDDIEIGKS
jgi:nitrite reductase/ring-hydroxylating ferredoxin subunit